MCPSHVGNPRFLAALRLGALSLLTWGNMRRVACTARRVLAGHAAWASQEGGRPILCMGQILQSHMA
jgi:hypothetical protein